MSPRAGRLRGTRWIRSKRPPKDPVDPSRPLGQLWEEERWADGSIVPTLTLFLTGAECPFTCLFCDLWRNTLDGPTPPGAIPNQVRSALKAESLPPSAAAKLYNASNFFDSRSVPPDDEPALAELLTPFQRVTVEAHPRLVGRRCLDFAHRLHGRLEVAMGLETVHPDALPRLNKRMTLDDFARAVRLLKTNDIGARAFVLVGAPFVPPTEAVEWAVRSTEWAFARGVDRVSLVPVRAGNGALEALETEDAFQRPSLAQLEEALERALVLEGGIVQADLWDARQFADCDACQGTRIARLGRMNLTGRPEKRSACPSCGRG